MSTKVKIGLMVLAGLIVLGLMIFLLLLPSRQAKAEGRAVEFVKEFGTFVRSGAADYRMRVEPYLADSYKDEFFGKFGVVELSGEARESYQRVGSAEIVETVSYSEEEAVFIVKYTGTRSEPPRSPEVTEFEINIQVFLVLEDGDWKVRRLEFA